MNRNKNIRNFIIIGICCYGIRLFWKPEIPNIISMVGGIIVAVIGLILIGVEQKTSNIEYYYGKNGGGLAPVVQVVNGAFILGISIAFFTINALAGIVSLCVGVLLILLLSKAAVTEKEPNEKHSHYRKTS
ncbi:MAG: hypothetical protein Q4C18_01885 [Eubacteriales bacterium]|nr:hypothetical protein [Eubacteriales bacterium]